MKPIFKTISGEYFDFDHPEKYNFRTLDIGKVLSRICRFSGHCERFYSVAQHSVIVSRVVSKEYAMAALFHDASEAFMGDMITPLKMLLPDYQALEDKIQSIIYKHHGISVSNDAYCHIKQADLIALRTEQRDIVNADNEIWVVTKDYKPLKKKIYPVAPNIAFGQFKQRLMEIYCDE